MTTRLTRLDLCGCALISEKAVCRLVRASPRLQCLLIEGCLKLGDETVSCIGETCGGLTELDVSGLPMLSPDPVVRLRLPRLRSLRLADCAKLTAAGVADCVLSCEALQQLCISRASLQKLGFTDVIAVASASLCRLRKLHVDGCAVTDENVTTLSKHCSALTSLNLSACAKIGDGAICDVRFLCTRAFIAYGCYCDDSMAWADMPLVHTARRARPLVLEAWRSAALAASRLVYAAPQGTKLTKGAQPLYNRRTMIGHSDMDS